VVTIVASKSRVFERRIVTVAAMQVGDVCQYRWNVVCRANDGGYAVLKVQYGALAG
jgi:hypothetical protein